MRLHLDKSNGASSTTAKISARPGAAQPTFHQTKRKRGRFVQRIRSLRLDVAIVTKLQFTYRRVMTAATALEKQIERYREMTGEQRLAVALELHEMSCDIAREGIRRQHPAADAAEVERLLRRRIELARSA